MDLQEKFFCETCNDSTIHDRYPFGDETDFMCRRCGVDGFTVDAWTPVTEEFHDDLKPGPTLTMSEYYDRFALKYSTTRWDEGELV